MAVKIKAFGKTASIDGGIWKSEDQGFRDLLLADYDFETITGYTPWPDYTLAEMACKVLGGKIVKATDPPEYVEGRVY